MTALLTALLGRLPIGWLQLTHNRNRFAAALAGVAFANVLIFMQLGFLGALMESVKLPYRPMAADILISAPDSNTLSDGSNLPRQRLFQALAVEGVADASPLYLGKLDWDREDGETIDLHVLGIDPERPVLDGAGIEALRHHLRRLDVALIDRKTRNVEPDFFVGIEPSKPYAFEANGRTLELIGSFEIGAGFDADGYMIVSDQTFLRLFPQRSAGAPSHVFVQVAPGADPQKVVERLAQRLPSSDSLVRPLETAAQADQSYQTTERPIGVVFGFGVIIGVLVGIIIVYQVLSSDVADHLSEYATLKAVGYGRRFFLGIVFEEAMVLAFLGFLPGLLISLGLYEVVAAATGLPIAMTELRPFAVLAGTTLMCMLSGAIATRRLAGADPADLF